MCGRCLALIQSSLSFPEQLHEGVKKAGLMGFCDPCPGESKQLKVAYSYLGHNYEVRSLSLGAVYVIDIRRA